MSGCARFETEGLLALEQGQRLDPHFAICPDCLAARAAHEAIKADLRHLGRSDEPPPGWQDKVFSRLSGRGPGQRAGRRARRFRPWLLPAGLAAAAGLAVVLVAPRLTAPAAPSLSARIEKGPTTYRSADEAQPGDLLRLEATADRRSRLELRLYRNDHELVAQCPGDEGPGAVGPGAEGPGTEAPACRVAAGSLALATKLEVPGSYQPLLLVSPQPLPPASGDFDADTAAALAAGAHLELGRAFVVR